MLEEQVTVLVHGTFANPGFAAPVDEAGDAAWWRRGVDGVPTAADRLQESLATYDPTATTKVWSPGEDVRDGDLTHRELGEWSGDNTHRARLRAARDLAASLDALADRRGCTAEDPLLVNAVAHSHGGNVVLQSLEYFSARVRPRQLCLLGTPLTWRFTDPRILYLFYLFLILGISLLAMGEGLVEGLAEPPDPMTGSALVLTAVFVYLLVAPLLLWSAVAAVSIARRLSSLLPSRPAYGPAPRRLTQMLPDRPVVLFISADDEADLMLQLGAAPMDAYRALVRGRPSLEGRTGLGRLWRRVVRVVELLYIRPLAYAVAIPVVEVLLERFGLGFPWWSVLVRNHEMVTWTGVQTYDQTQVVTRYIGADDLREVAVVPPRRRIPRPTRLARRPGVAPNAERLQALRLTVLETAVGLRRQVRLQHSSYYESESVIDEVARTLVGGSPAADPPHSTTTCDG